MFSRQKQRWEGRTDPAVRAAYAKVLGAESTAGDQKVHSHRRRGQTGGDREEEQRNA